MYAFAFLVSVVRLFVLSAWLNILTKLLHQAVHRDPFGSKPRSTLFANEGLRTIDAKLSGSECASFFPSSGYKF